MKTKWSNLKKIIKKKNIANMQLILSMNIILIEVKLKHAINFHNEHSFNLSKIKLVAFSDHN